MNKIITLACTAFALASTACYASGLVAGSYDNGIAAADVSAQGIVTIKDPEAKDTIVFDTAAATTTTKRQHGSTIVITVHSVQIPANQTLYTLQYQTSLARPEAHSFTVTPEGMYSSRFVTLAKG